MKYNNLLEAIIDDLYERKQSDLQSYGYTYYKSVTLNKACDCDMISLIQNAKYDNKVDVSRYTVDYGWRVERSEVGHPAYKNEEYESEETLPEYVKHFIEQAGIILLGADMTNDILEEEQTTKGYSPDIEDESTNSPTEATPYTQEDLDEAKYTASEESYMEGYHVGRAEAYEEVCNKLISKITQLSHD